MVKVYTDEEMFKPKKRRGRPRKIKDTDSDHFNESDNLLGKELEEMDILKAQLLSIKTKEEKPDKKKYYVDTKRLEALIEQYYKDSIIGDELAMALYNIAHRMSFLPNFINYSWKDEMIGDGIVKEFKALRNKKYNQSLGRAFSYFSQIVFNAFCNKIKVENKNNEALKNYQSQQYDALVFENNGHQSNTHNNEEEHD
jgi:hypothetical protein